MKRELISSSASSHEILFEVACVAFALTFRRRAPHGVHHPVRRVDAIKIFRHFRAKKAARYRMRRIALHARGPAIFHGDQNSAGVRTIVRANGVNDLLHRDIIRSFSFFNDPRF